MTRREKIFWIIAGLVLVVGFISLIPAHGEICREAEKAQQECAAYSLVLFLIIKIGKILDALGVAVTALATIAIAWFTLSLRRSTDKLWEAGERQIGIAAQMAELTRQQVAIASSQTDIQIKQHAVGRLQFLAAHRPLLRVRYFKQTSDGDEAIRVAFTIVNIGTGPAELAGSRVAIEFFSPRALPTPFYLGGQDITAPRRFEPGATDEYSIGFPVTKNRVLELEATGKNLFIFGTIIYADDNGDTRTTAFCRRWDTRADRFYSVEDTDYEHED